MRNFFIVLDRSNIGAKPIAFQKYREYWLDPLFDAFPIYLYTSLSTTNWLKVQ